MSFKTEKNDLQYSQHSGSSLEGTWEFILTTRLFISQDDKFPM